MTKKKKSLELSLFEIQRRILKHRNLLEPYYGEFGFEVVLEQTNPGFEKDFEMRTCIYLHTKKQKVSIKSLNKIKRIFGASEVEYIEGSCEEYMHRESMKPFFSINYSEIVAKGEYKLGERVFKWR